MDKALHLLVCTATVRRHPCMVVAITHHLLDTAIHRRLLDQDMEPLLQYTEHPRRQRMELLLRRMAWILMEKIPMVRVTKEGMAHRHQGRYPRQSIVEKEIMAQIPARVSRIHMAKEVMALPGMTAEMTEGMETGVTVGVVMAGDEGIAVTAIGGSLSFTAKVNGAMHELRVSFIDIELLPIHRSCVLWFWLGHVSCDAVMDVRLVVLIEIK